MTKHFKSANLRESTIEIKHSLYSDTHEFNHDKIDFTPNNKTIKTMNEEFFNELINRDNCQQKVYTKKNPNK